MKKTLLIAALISIQFIGLSQWINLNTSIPGDLNEVFFADTNTGLVVGDSGVFKTLNGGVSWSKQILSGNVTDSISFLNTKFNSVHYYNGFWYAAGKDRASGNGVIYRDSASNWSLSFSVVNKEINSISKINIGVTAVGDSGIIIYSNNNGNSWLPSYSGTNNQLNYVIEQNSRAYIGGESILLRKYSGSSATWYRVSGQSVKQLIVPFSGNPVGVSPFDILEGSSLSSINSNYSGFLQPTSIDFIAFQAEACIGSANGIYRSTNRFNFWEKVTSSASYHINDLHFISGGNFGYAVGLNGLVLKTRNAGGDALPLIILSNSNGACTDSLVSFINDTIKGYTYSWKINGTSFSNTNDYDLDTSFSSTGTYTVRLIGDNGSFSDSVDRTFQVVNLPDTNKTITLSDSLLCKTGNSDVLIHNSQINTSYQLIRLPDFALISSGIGNGASLILNTGVITDSTYYLMKAKSTFADCDIYYSDTILVGVEKTKADFHSVYINADLGENIKMFNNSQQASYFNWDFGTGSSIATSTNFEETINYSTLGQSQTTLIATSIYGCKDTLIKNGAFIYDESIIQEGCWAFAFGNNASYSSFQGNDYSVKHMNSGDILVTGRQFNFLFKTKVGVLGNSSDVGLFLARYTSNGVLKWIVKVKPSASGYQSIRDIEIDKNDNIYFVGIQGNSSLHINTGKVIQLQGGSIIKLDSNGQYVWHTETEKALGFELELDDSANVYIDGLLSPHSSSSPCKFYSTSGTFLTMSGLNFTNFILKMDSSGQMKWVTSYNLVRPFGTIQRNNYFSVNGNGQIFITGTQNGQTIFRSVSGVLDSLKYSTSFILAKYRSNGNLEWSHVLGDGFSYTKGYSVVSDDDGNCYVAASLNSYCILPSVNKANDSSETSGYNIISYDKNGDLNWIVGSKNRQSFCKEVTIDKQGNIYSLGFINDVSEIVLDGISTDGRLDTLQPNHHSNLSFVITKHNKHGELIWTTLQNGRDSVLNLSFGNEDFNSISVDQKQNIFISGTFEVYSSSPSGFIIAKDTLSSNIGSSVYLAKFSSSGCLQSDSLIALVSSGPYCEGSIIKIPFYTPSSVNFVSSNIYTLELSDSGGSFSTPTVIGTLSSTANRDTISGIIPTGVFPFKNYKVRIVSSNPSIIGNESFINIGVSSLAPLKYNDTICENKQVLLTPNLGYKYSWSPSLYLNDTLSKIGVSAPKSSIQYLVTVDNYCATVIDTFNLLVDSISYDSITVTACNSYILPSGTQTINSSGTYYDTLASSLSCDSVLKIKLTIIPLNPIVLQRGAILTSLQVGASYQWLDCNNGYALISGETNKDFIPATNGDYAVEITNNGCVDTSNCRQIYNVSINEVTNDQFTYIFPNPNQGEFRMIVQSPNSVTRVYITDISGKLIQEVTVTENSNLISIKGTSGIYFLHVNYGAENKTYKIIKQ